LGPTDLPGASAAADAADRERIAAAWVACYLDPLKAIELGRRVAEGGGALAAEGWLHVALGEVRAGDVKRALPALEQARQGFGQAGDRRGLALCDEVQAIRLRHLGDCESARRLMSDIDTRGDQGYTHCDRFIALNSRAITCKLLGHVDEALRFFYGAVEAAQASGLEGPRITALTNLGGYHQDLYNLEDARHYSEEALRAARQARAPVNILTAAVNLIITYHATGLFAESRAMAGYLTDRAAELLPGDLERRALPLALAHLGVGEIEQAQRYLNRGADSDCGDGDGVTLWAWLQTRCLLAGGNLLRARAVAEETLQARAAQQLADVPYEHMQLLNAAADACEALGDAPAALAFVRRAHKVHELLVGRSARARYMALQASHELAQAQRERDSARDSHRNAEDDRRRLVQLNEALQAQARETDLLHARLREQALRDPLTGLHNRRYLFEMSPGLLDLARRQASPLCVVLIDLDHFKLLNDTFGHHAGDAVLQRFATLLAQMLRRSDVVCRHGGEEFVAVMPDIDASGAQTMLVRLLEAYQAQQQEIGRRKLPSCSFSAGIAVFPTHGSSLEQLLSRADRALYSAKARGRARIESMPMTDFGTFR
jgi:diguanylate cyclase (GGDEF)-like protein